MGKQPSGTSHLVLLYVLCYVFWFGFMALGLWTLLQWRDAILGLLPIVGPWVMGALDKFAFLFLGVLLLAWIMYVEGYLRHGVEKGLFWQRTGRIALIQFIALIAAYGFQYLPILFM